MSIEKIDPSPVKEYMPVYHTLQALKKDQTDEQFKHFLNLLKQFHINILFVEALSQMLKYAKSLKDLLTNKLKFKEVSIFPSNQDVKEEERSNEFHYSLHDW